MQDVYRKHYAQLLEDRSFQASDCYQQFMMGIPLDKVWTSPLLNMLNTDKDSYSAALAVQRLTQSRTGDVLEALTDCLRDSSSLLVKRMAVQAIRQQGWRNQKTIDTLREVAYVAPELRGSIERTLAAIGITDLLVDGSRTMSWIEGPKGAKEYLVRKVLDIGPRGIEQLDIRITSWDVYEVRFNGQVVGVKPSWANTKYLDLRPFARNGKNEFIVRVIRQENVPEAFAETWTLGAAYGPEGIIAKICIKQAGVENEVVYSDESWLVASVRDADWIEDESLDSLQWTTPIVRQSNTSNLFAYSTAID